MNKLVVWLLLAIFVVGAGGCAQSAGDGDSNTEEAEHGSEHEAGQDDEGEGTDRIPNAGSVIRIVSPEDGAAFARGEDIVVEVEIENFELNVDGSHWHVYVDGVSYGMVVGDVLSQVLRNLEPGEHKITAHLANGSHIELEDPGRVTITVTE